MAWKEAAEAVRWNIRPFVDGRYRGSHSSEGIDNINPATETSLCRFGVGDPADIDEAVGVARRRFTDGCWARSAAAKRAAILLKLADLVTRQQTELALLDTLEMGKPIESSLDDAGNFAPSLLRSWAGLVDKLVGASAPLHPQTLSFNTYEPRGVVGAIVPWNFPTVNAVIKFAPALAAGNSVVLKPSEISPSSALKLAELALEAGVPEGVLNVVPGLGSTVGAALALHPDVDMLSFTGSTATGRKIMELSGCSNGKPVLLECGGKSPQIVFDDAGDLGAIADSIVQSALWNQGQVCSAHTRILVQEEIKDTLLEKIVARARRFRPADPLEETTSFGPLASPVQRDRVRAYIERGLQSGARAVLLGNVQHSGGCYVAPTIFDRVDGTMAIVREEIFGPVMCVQTFQTEADAVALANDNPYGLEATVWTRDMGRAMRLAHAIQAGVVSIRASSAAASEPWCQLSSEPRKASGFGAEVGIKGLESYSTLKLVNLSGA